jgi:hypothetical protein
VIELADEPSLTPKKAAKQDNVSEPKKEVSTNNILTILTVKILTVKTWT